MSGTTGTTSSSSVSAPLTLCAAVVVLLLFGVLSVGRASPDNTPHPQPKPSTGQELVVEVGYTKIDRSVSVEPRLIVNGQRQPFQATDGDTTYTIFVHRSGPHQTPPEVAASITKSGGTSQLKVWCKILYGDHVVHEEDVNTVNCYYPL